MWKGSSGHPQLSPPNLTWAVGKGMLPRPGGWGKRWEPPSGRLQIKAQVLRKRVTLLFVPPIPNSTFIYEPDLFLSSTAFFYMRSL